MYQLIYSRSRSNPDPVTFGDVPVTTSSIMIDVLSLASKIKRAAGWIYPCIPAGNDTFERGQSKLLLFGKNRLTVIDYAPPYNLQFYPYPGVKNYIVSVYTGFPSPPDPHDWVPYPSSGREFKLTPGTGISTREISSGQSQFEAAEGAQTGFIYQNYLYWSMSDNTLFRREIGVWNPVFLVSSEMFIAAQSAPSTLVL